jgi:hypothetical protein
MNSRKMESGTLILIKALFLEWVEPLTIQGIPSMFRAKHTIFRITWALLFLIGAAITIFMFVTTINDYLEFEVVTKIKTVEETSTIFPQVFFFFTKYSTQIHLN